MSADNWTVCPACQKKAEIKREELIQAVETGYGKLPAEKYEQILLKSRENIELDATFREDFEIGIMISGEFEIDYHAYCNICGFQYEFKHSMNVFDSS